MSTVWVAILVFVSGSAGLDGLVNREAGRPTVVSVVGRSDAEVPRCVSIGRSDGRNLGPRHHSTPWSAGALEEFDTEDLDETWMIYLDLLATLPLTWLAWNRRETRLISTLSDETGSPFPTSHPLRC